MEEDGDNCPDCGYIGKGDDFAYHDCRFVLRRRIAALEAEKAEMERQEPVAWMRKWAFDGETPTKERNSRGRMALAFRFRLLEVTRGKCLPNDVPLYARNIAAAHNREQAEPELVEALSSLLDASEGHAMPYPVKQRARAVLARVEAASERAALAKESGNE